MNKKILILLLALLIVVTGNTISYARENLFVTLEEPASKDFVRGEEVTYKLNIRFEGPLEDYQTMHLTYRFSEGLDYVSSNFVGVEQVKDRVDITSNPNEEGRYGFLTVKVTDTAALKGKSEFSVIIKAKINDKLEEGSTILNRVIVAYQLKNQIQDSESKYYEISQKSKSKIYNSAPVEQVLLTKTGDIYADFVSEIEGKTSPGNTLQARYLDQVESVSVDEKGNFRFRVPDGLTSNITISSLDGNGNVYKTKILKYVDETTMNQAGLDSVIKALKEFGYEDRVNRLVEEYKLQVAQMELLMGIEGGTIQEMYNFFERLYLDTRSKYSMTSLHAPFMNGYPEGTFLPKNSITRAEAATILSRIIANGEVTDRTSSFSDVESGKWYTKYIAHLSEQGIMKGYENGLFKPQYKITRAEFATIVSRINNLSRAELITYPDLKENYWASGDIIKVATAGIMEGYPDGTFGPTLNVTRAEAATIINRMLNRVADEKYIREHNITGFSDIKNHWAYLQIVEATYEHEFLRSGNQEIYK